MTDWRTHGKGLRGIARELNRLNIRTPRGCQWYACTVKARLPLLVAALQDAAWPMHPLIRGTSMIDQHEKTDLLIARLKESLPIEANIASPLAKLLAEKSPDTPIPAKCNVTSVFYTGDMGGIICGLDIGGPNTETPHLVSITHLTFHRHVPLSCEIEAYQRHRTKKLRQQQDRGY
jgi:hypothetical protein